MPVTFACEWVDDPPVVPYVVDASAKRFANASEELDTVVHPTDASPVHMPIIWFVGVVVAVSFARSTVVYGGS
jgi:hypothetical protein